MPLEGRYCLFDIVFALILRVRCAISYFADLRVIFGGALTMGWGNEENIFDNLWVTRARIMNFLFFCVGFKRLYFLGDVL